MQRLRAVFFDRDGVINRLIWVRKRGVFDSPYRPSQFKFFPGMRRSLSIIRKLGFKSVIVSNQPGVAKSLVSEQEFRDLDLYFKSRLAKQGAVFDGIYYCFHHPQADVRRYRKICSCRKPKPGLLKRAARELGVRLNGSYLIGDRAVDMTAGRKTGCITILIGKRHRSKIKSHYVCRTLLQSAKLIEKLEKETRNGPLH